MSLTTSLKRLPARRNTCMIPRPLGYGLVEVDATWGEVQPAEIAPGIRTIGELELIEHLEQGRPIVDTRQPEFFREGTIPGARSMPHDQIAEHIGELDPHEPTVFFCNGPQCKATPDAVGRLLDAGFPASSIRYYRGGMHDWMTLGYPVD